MTQAQRHAVARKQKALAGMTSATLRASYRARETGDLQFVEALARGLAILRSFRAGDKYLGNQEIAKRTALPKPTVSRLTYTLTRTGFLTHAEHRDEYALGVGVLALGHVYLASMNIRDVARPFMQELADYSKATVSLGEGDGPRMVVVEICHGSPSYRLKLDVGERVPHNTTALGRAFLAGLSPERREISIRNIVDRAPAESREAVADSIKKATRDYERHGFVFSCGDWKADVFAVGVPLVSHDGTRILSLSCSGPAFEMTRKRLMAEIAPRVLKLRDQILKATQGYF